MATRTLTRAIQRLSQQLGRLVKQLTKGVVHWLLRVLLVVGRTPLSRQAGFVLPTTVLLLLVLTLTVGSIGYRTYTRSQETIGERQQRVIYNAGTPAIDRAKAKLEFMFDRQRDSRLPAGIPSEVQLLGMLYNDGRSVEGVVTSRLPDDTSTAICGSSTCDVYTFPGETRISIDSDSTRDNAWSYRIDSDGNAANNAADGFDATVVYSILFSTPVNYNELGKASDTDVRARANALQVRHGPLSNSSQQNQACILPGAATAAERGWIPDATQNNTLRKNFQIDVFVQPDNANGTVSTLEVHQDREVNRGNKWGAWFRNDLEVFPGPVFNWNGAMHSEGSLIVGGDNRFRGYMISSPYSCFYTKDASEITVREFAQNDATGQGSYQGQFLSGLVGTNKFDIGTRTDGTTYPIKSLFHLFDGQGQLPLTGTETNFDQTKDSLNNNNSNAPGPADYSLDPVLVQTLDISQGRTVPNPGQSRDANWNDQSSMFVKQGRMRQETASTTPYVDDFFRADNRYGPKPRYTEGADGAINGPIGTPIASNRPDLTFSDPDTADAEEQVGLDGYWERRARVSGLRVVVGQRLELGDPLGWGGKAAQSSTSTFSDEPLRPWETCSANSAGRCNEARQRTTLWDNLAAVQGSVVYHASASSSDSDEPVACLATTVHPGTALTLANSSTFQDLAYGLPTTAFASQYGSPSTNANKFIATDVFSGIGTNGWEFGNDAARPFDPDVTRNPDLIKALFNLAYFAGDPNGGAPSFTPVQDTNVHPFPSMAMWGDFSPLRRVLAQLGANPSSAGYQALSPADKTTLHSAACTLGILAYNLDYLEKFDPLQIDTTLLGNLITNPTLSASNPSSTSYKQGLRGAIRQIWDGSSPLGTYPKDSGILNSFDDNVSQPQVYIRLLERWRDRISPTATTYPTRDDMNKMINLARLIVEKEQVARDRVYGFNDDAASYGKDPLGYCSLWAQASPKTFDATGALQDISALMPSGLTSAQQQLIKDYQFEPLRQLCSRRPRYPMLYSLFPARDNETFATTASTVKTAYQAPNAGTYATFDNHGEVFRVTRDNQDSTDPLTWNGYIFRSDVNRGINYRVVRPELVALRPRNMNRTDWVSPIEAPTAGEARYSKTGTGITPNHNRDTLIKICATGVCPNDVRNPDLTINTAGATGSLFRVAFKDSAPFNAREMMPTRMLDVNLDLLRRTAVGNGDFWLPRRGIVYAYREDAVSEREIVRPSQTAWTSCDTDAKQTSVSTCKMNTGTVSALRSTDPPLNSDNGITAKPVDYYPDPDRRPYGFRLKNGYRMDRTGDEGRGLSFITDNPVYIQGDFNLHQATPGGAVLEEFTTQVDVNFTNFYSRSSLNSSFARIATDLWRPSEILADAVSIISENFCDGSIEDTFMTSGVATPTLAADKVSLAASGQRSISYGCQTSPAHNRTSYLNQNRPNGTFTTATTSGVRWFHSNPADSFGFPASTDTTIRVDEGGSPIVVSRDSNPFYLNGNGVSYGSTVSKYGVLTTQKYYLISDSKPLMDAGVSPSGSSGMRVNASIISGLVPSRVNQSYGGLHNFPRFLETWNGRPLFISGSFLQLNFSNQATGAFDQDAWEPSLSPTTTEQIGYYSPPDRRWGYDVGLQYAPAGPIAARFVTLRSIRNEFYSEPAANDPYMYQLCLKANQANPQRCPAP